MTPSNRIALPLAITLHLLALYALEKWTKLPRSDQMAAREALTVRFIPFFPMKPAMPEAAPLLRDPIAQSGKSERRAASIVAQRKNIDQSEQTSGGSAPITQTNVEPRSRLNDAAALVKAYSYEDSKSDLQKAIESHGGTVALVEKSKYETFHDAAEFASIPNCLGPDALKHNPPKIGPIGLSGLFVLPFLADAALTGKCK